MKETFTEIISTSSTSTAKNPVKKSQSNTKQQSVENHLHLKFKINSSFTLDLKNKSSNSYIQLKDSLDKQVKIFSFFYTTK